MKRILVPTDFSPGSRKAITHAVDLLKKTPSPAHLLLLNTYLVLGPDPYTALLKNDVLKRESTSKLEMEKREINETVNNPLVTVETACHLGSLQNVIQRFWNNGNFDLVIINNDNEANTVLACGLRQKGCVLVLV